MNSGTKLLALCFALLMAVPIIFYMPPAFSQTESTELSPKVQKSNDLNSAYDSLQDAYKNFPQRAARAKADLDSFLSACGQAFLTVQHGFIKAAPDFGKAMNSVSDSIRNAARSFDKSVAKNESTAKHIPGA